MRNVGGLMIAALACGSVSAQEPVLITYWGHGNDSCGSFILALERRSHNELVEVQGEQFPSQAHSYYQWAAGYLAASSNLRQIDYPLPNNKFDGGIVWLRSWCLANPTASFMEAVAAYAQQNGTAPRSIN